MLTLFSAIYAKWFLGADGEESAKFLSSQSTDAVTKHVKIETTGNLTMIDSPGFNDTSRKRTDQDIHFELINTVRPIFSASDLGVNAFILCIMPDKGGRIKLSSVNAIC